MKIIAHRINKIAELKDVQEEYGVEIDIRSYQGKLILNHEPHEDGDSLEEYLKACGNRFIIFNIKEAGVEDEVIALAKKQGITEYFLLDVEFPYLYRATRTQGIKDIAVRFSEAEPIEMSLAQKGLVKWVWIDTNTILPINKENYDTLKKAGFKLCLVCPERWGRPEDITPYKEYMEKNNIKVDAVMTNIKYADQWK